MRLFDCIEFNPALRIMDNVAGIAFSPWTCRPGVTVPSRTGCCPITWNTTATTPDWVLAATVPVLFRHGARQVALLREPADHDDIRHTGAYNDFSRYLALAGQYCQLPDRFLAITHGYPAAASPPWLTNWSRPAAPAHSLRRGAQTSVRPRARGAQQSGG